MSRNPNRHKEFHFKQFTLTNEISAMKISTDGVLLGAWTDVCGKKNILDIGTGTGLIALMAAQRNLTANITAIDIDDNACCEATNNVQNSLWKDRIKIIQCDFKLFEFHEKYDLIVSNPPYFNNGIKAADLARATARHCDSLDYSDIISRAGMILTGDGTISLIAPADRLEEITYSGILAGFEIIRLTKVCTKENTEPTRIMVELGKKHISPKCDILTIRNNDGDYTPQYISLTKPFYINF